MAYAIHFDPKVVGSVRVLLGRFAPTQDRLHTLQQNLVAERLGDVVVSALGEALDLVCLFSAGGEHDDGNGSRLLRGAQLAADVQPLHSRQHQIEQNQVG